MKLPNNRHLPQPIVDAIANDDYTRGDANISVTQLISPPRKVELERRHGAELEEDASDRIFALVGQAIHTILERAGITHETEQRLYMDVGGWRISGQLDRMADGKITDWKTATVNEIIYGVKPERELQLNCYAALARANGYPVTALEAVFILRDWSKVRASKGGGYPSSQVVVVPLPLWTPERALSYLADRVQLHKAVRDGTLPLPECSAEDRWAKPDMWAVKKAGRKSAVRVLEWEAEAHAFINSKDLKGHYIERRPGESLRCQFYCSAAPVCDQWAAIKAQQGEDEVDG